MVCKKHSSNKKTAEIKGLVGFYTVNI